MDALAERIGELMRNENVALALFLRDQDTAEQLPNTDALVPDAFLGMLAFKEGLRWHTHWVSHVPPDDLELSVALFEQLQKIRESLVAGMLRHHPPEIVWFRTGFERVG